MKRGLLLIVILVYAVQLCAQNWMCFNPDSASYYWDNNRLMRAIVIQQTDADGKWYNFEVVTRDTACDGAYPYDRGYRFDGLSWLGQEVDTVQNSVFIFRNEAGDSLIIHTQEQPGYSWVFYHKGTDTLWAQVIDIVQDSVLGRLDSIKHIELSYQHGGIVDSSVLAWDGGVFRLSKDQGLINFPFIRSFPTKNICTKTLDRPLRNYDVYNYQVGDKFQFHTYFFDGIILQDYYKLYLVTNVERRGDTSVTYQMVRETINVVDDSNITVSLDTISPRYDRLQFYVYTGIPFKYYSDGALTYCRFYLRNPNGRKLRISGSKWFKSFSEDSIQNQSCHYINYQADGEGCYLDDDISGLGHIYDCSGIGGVSRNYYVYYESEGEVFGKRYTLLDDPDSVSVELNVYPNPANITMVIKMNALAQVHVKIVNTLGQLVYDRNLEDPFANVQVDVTSFESGVYFLKAESRGTVLSRKILIQH